MMLLRVQDPSAYSFVQYLHMPPPKQPDEDRNFRNIVHIDQEGNPETHHRSPHKNEQYSHERIDKLHAAQYYLKGPCISVSKGR